MATTASEAQRMGMFKNPLGPDRLNLRRFVGSEYVNGLFEFRVETVDEEKNVDFNDLLGKPGIIELDTILDEKRHFHGVIAECEWTGGVDGLHGYTLTLRPWLWVATMQRNQRIFHEKSVIDIIKEVLGDYSGFGGKIKDDTKGQSAKLHYTVQYRESDFAFCSRLMERHGINYHFEHTASGHTMVLSDDTDGFTSIGKREFIQQVDQHVTGEERFWLWEKARRLTTGKLKVSDFNFLKPTSKMDGEATGNEAKVNDKINAYDWPGHNPDSGKATKVAQLRVDQERALDHRQHAEGDVLTLGAGSLVDLTGTHEGGASGSEYLCLEATHAFTNADYATGGGSTGPSYSGSYTLFPTKYDYKPPRLTPEARIDGPQTGTVVTKPGEDIDVDAHGRILVHLHWDLETACTMRVRCAQLWAHKQWGAMFIPRKGMEVVVVFIEGDPENPLVVGCVYNGANKPPWDLPGDKNTAGIKSRSTKAGAADNYNEIAFDDTKGKELFRQQAEKDMQTLVKNDERRHVMRDRSTEIDRDEKRIVGRDETHHIKRDQTYLIDKDSDWAIKGKEDRLVHKNRTAQVKMKETLTVGMDQTETVKGKRTTSINMDDKLTVKMGNVSRTVKMGSVKDKVSMGSIKTEVSLGSISTKVSLGSIKTTASIGNITTKASVGKITQQAMSAVELKCGSNSIKIDQTGVTIKGIMVKIQGTAMAELKAPMTKVEGSGMLIVKGGVVMIN